jgi:integron integrase
MSLEIKLRRTIRLQGKQDATADVYWYWSERFLRWCKSFGIGKETKAETAVTRFLSELANEKDMSANTQNQAFWSLCFLYRHVLGRPLENVQALRAKAPQRVRDVADQSEIAAIFAELRGPALLAARMMYGCNFRIGEVGKLRIKDISFERRQIVIRGAKGEKDRYVGFPEVLHDAVQRQIESVKVLWRSDVADGANGVSLPKAFGRKSPSAHLEFAWYYLMAADHPSRDPVSGRMLRHHRDMDNVARQIKQASRRAGVSKRITSHCLRHSYATHSIEQGVPIHVVQKLMGHNDITTTETYLHASKDGVTAARSPLENLLANPEPRPEVKPPAPAAAEPIKLRLFAG